MRLCPLLLVVASPALPSWASSQTPLPLAPGARVVTASPLGREEPTIAVNPVSPNQVVVAFQGPAEVAYSQDSGRTFAPATGTEATGWRRDGDVSLTFDNKGLVYLAYIAIDSQGIRLLLGSRERTKRCGRTAVARRREDLGAQGAEVRVPPVSANTPFQDMDRIFADKNPNSPFAGHLYIGWIEWQLDSSIMLFSRSVDSGRTWSPAMRISTHAGLPRDGNGDVVGFNGTVGSDGAVYAVWHDGNRIVFTSSRDGGRTFAPSRPDHRDWAAVHECDSGPRPGLWRDGLPADRRRPTRASALCGVERLHQRRH